MSDVLHLESIEKTNGIVDKLSTKTNITSREDVGGYFPKEKLKFMRDRESPDVPPNKQKSNTNYIRLKITSNDIKNMKAA